MQVLCKAAEMSIPMDDEAEAKAKNKDKASATGKSVEGVAVQASTPLMASLQPKAASPTDNGTILYSLPSARPNISDSRDMTASPTSIKRYREEEREQSSPISHDASSRFPPRKQAKIDEESTIHGDAASGARPLPMYPPVIPEVVNLPLSRPAQKSGNTRKRGWVKKTWEERLEELKAYKKSHGDCNVPTLSKENPSLGHWVHDQRKQYRLHETGRPTSMTDSRIQQLESIGFKWALQRHTTMKSWWERFEELRQFKATQMHTNVPIRWRENPSLGQWVSTQRQEYGNLMSGRKTNITQGRIDALESIGFVWCLRDTTKMAPRKTWDMHFKALEDFKKENGHCDVRVRSKQNPSGSLGRWVEKQRSQYHLKSEGKASKITDEQINKLESIGFKWRVRNDPKTAKTEVTNVGDNVDL